MPIAGAVAADARLQRPVEECPNPAHWSHYNSGFAGK